MKVVERLFFPDPVNLPAINTKMGRLENEPVPLRALEAFVSDAIQRVRYLGGPTTTPEDEARVQREVDSIMVYGAAGLSAFYSDELTHVEEMRAELDTLRKTRDVLRALLPRPGAAMTAEQVDRLRGALGTANDDENPAGTPAPDASAAEPDTSTPLVDKPMTDDEMRESLFDWAKQTGFKYPADVKAYRAWLESKGYPDSHLERWLNYPPGSVARHFNKLGD